MGAVAVQKGCPLWTLSWGFRNKIVLWVLRSKKIQEIKSHLFIYKSQVYTKLTATTNTKRCKKTSELNKAAVKCSVKWKRLAKNFTQNTNSNSGGFLGKNLTTCVVQCMEETICINFTQNTNSNQNNTFDLLSNWRCAEQIVTKLECSHNLSFYLGKKISGAFFTLFYFNSIWQCTQLFNNLNQMIRMNTSSSWCCRTWRLKKDFLRKLATVHARLYGRTLTTFHLKQGVV